MDVRAPPRGTFEFGPYRLDAARGVLTRQGEAIALTPRLLETLLYLVENPGRVLSKEEMLHALWPGRIADETNLSQAIFTLRKALADGADGDRMIVTVPGRGYRFTPEVRIATAGLAVLPRPAPPPAATGRRHKPWVFGAASLAVLVAAVGIGASILHERASRLPPDRTGVVLADFQNFTGEALFSHVLGKALEIDLAQSPFLRVTPQHQVAETLGLMARRRDEPLTEALARDVCVRENGGAVIAGAIAALGTRYLLTLTASDCVTGRILDEEKEEAGTKEAIAPALDRLASQTRQKLGESQASIARFGVPLLPERTGSFDALRSYSDGVWLVDHGQGGDAVPLFRHAITLDANFTAAYEALATALVNARQYEAAAEATTKAYQLRDYVSERRKLHIVDIYTHNVSKDLDAELDNLRLWTRLYPSDPTPWTSLANLESFVGHHPAAVEAAKQALALRGDAESSYAILIRAETRAGLFAEAQAVGDRVIAKGLAGQNTHNLLMTLAYARHDIAGVQKQLDWAKGKSAEPMMMFWAAKIALAEGRLRQATDLSERAVELGRSQGLTYQDQAAQALTLAQFGLTARARALLAGVSPDTDLEDFLHATATIGDAGRAERELTLDLAKRPSDTLLHCVYAPLTRASLFLRRGQAAEAARALLPASSYELRDFDVPYLRGLALSAAKDSDGAATSFRLILANPGLGPDPEYPLAHLGLARALLGEDDVKGSRQEYEAFLAAWKDADSDLPILRQAKAEYATLHAKAPPRIGETAAST